MIYFLAPFYNEEEFLTKFIKDLDQTAKKLFKNKYKIILVNDGSLDDSLKIIKDFKNNSHLKVISYKPNRGVDHAFKTGFKEIFKTAKKDDLIVTLESDNTGDLKILSGMIKKLNNGADIVLASCHAKGGGVYGTGFLRQLTSKIANLLMYIIFPIKGVKDYTSGYRSYRVEIIKQAREFYKGDFISEKGFTCMVDILLKLRRFDPLCTEVPMILRYDQKIGKSKMNVPLTIAQSLNLIGRYVKKSVMETLFGE
jgi:dolichol-phosphate mannosyltransferase